MAKKDFGKRLIPEYLLKYSEDLFKNHPDPSASWGGGSEGGGDYTAGDGININDNVISVDDTIAKKSDIPSRVKSPFLGVRQITDGTVLFSETGEDDDYYSVYHVINPVKVNLRALNPKFGNGLTSSYDSNNCELNVTVDTTTVALKSDIPSLDGYATQTWVQNQGYSKFSGSYNDLTDKPDLSIYAKTSNLSTVATTGSYNDLTDKPTLATVATSGSYNDLTDKPYIIPSSRIVTTDEIQTISGVKTFEDNIKIKEVTGAQKTAIFPDTFDYTSFDPVTHEKSRTKFKLPISKPKGTEESPTEYTLATTADIPAVPTVNDSTITFTQGGVTKGSFSLNQAANQTIELDAGGAQAPAFEITNMVVDSSAQTITLTITQNN